MSRRIGADSCVVDQGRIRNFQFGQENGFDANLRELTPIEFAQIREIRVKTIFEVGRVEVHDGIKKAVRTLLKSAFAGLFDSYGYTQNGPREG